MKSDKKIEEIVRKRVLEILKEYQGGGDMGMYGDAGPYYGGYGMGVQYPAKGELSKIFLDPFKDVFKTAVGQTKEFTRKLLTLLRVTVEAVLSTIIPFARAEYDKIFDKEKEDINRIRQEYKDVYERTNKAFSDSDVAILAFFTYPTAAVSALAVSKAPKLARGILDVFTGGISEKLLSKSKGRYSESFQRLIEKKSETSLSDVLGSKKFILKSIENSPQAASIIRTAREVHFKTLKDSEEEAKRMLGSLNTIEDLEKISGKNKDIDKIKSMSGDEREKAEKQLLMATKESLKKMYVDALQSRINEALKNGIPESSGFISDHKNTIATIQKL